MGNACSEGIVRLIDAGPRRLARPPPPPRLAAARTSALQHVSRRTNSTTKLLETYDLAELVGEGAFGSVRKSASRKTGCRCVVKSAEKRGPEERAALANEVAIHAMCDHPNIVRIFEIFDNPTWIHIAMEACEGGDLFELLYESERQECALGEDEARPVMQQVLHALVYLHGVRHVVHRDLKLENLLLKYRGRALEENVVKVIDFGLAAPFLPGRASLDKVCGTAEYLAPEVDDGPYDEKCDLWSCGVVLHELLLGLCPFQAEDPEEVRWLVKAGRLSLEGCAKGPVSPELRRLARRLCRQEPSERPSAEEALSSPWLQPRTPPASPRMPAVSSCASVAENLRAFPSCSSLQKLALRVAASRLDDPELVEQRTAFQLLDKNGDGRLTPEEVTHGCPELGLAATEARGLFRHLDVDGNGSIEYSEFLSAAISKDRLTDHACWEAFRFCDRDNSGSISEKNVWELLHGARPLRLGAARLAERGCGGGGEAGGLDYEQFASMLRSPRGGRV